MQNPSRLKRSKLDDEEDGEGVLDTNSLILVTVNQRKNRVEVHIRGPFVPPHMVSTQIATLYEMAEQYDTVLIYINSPGGSVDTLTELLSAFGRFETIITVAAGRVSSAGFFLWSAGHIRVVQKYTVLMAHRESYHFDGKTDQHIDFGVFTNKICGSMIEDLCGHLLTDDEKVRIKTTEVFLSDQDMIDRNKAITWSQFISRDNFQPEYHTIMTLDGVDYTVEEDSAIDEDGNVYNIAELIYDIPEKTVYRIDSSEEV